MGGSPRKSERLPPSYEEGRLRDAEIERKQDPKFKERDLLALIKRAVKKKAPSGA